MARCHSGTPLRQLRRRIPVRSARYELVEKRGLKRFQARTYMCFGNMVMPWTRHVRAGRDLVRRAFDAANQIGDLTFAAYSCNHLITNLLAAGDELAVAERDENGLAFARTVRFGLIIDDISAQLGPIRTLRGFTRQFGSFNDDEFDERRFEQHLSDNSVVAEAECWYSIRKLQAHFLAGDLCVSRQRFVEGAQRLLWTSPSQFETAELHFNGSLSHAASWDTASPESNSSTLRLLQLTTGSLKYGRATVRRTFEIEPHW